MAYSLLIKETDTKCTSLQVMKVINEILNDNIVSSVDEIVFEGSVQENNIQYKLVTNKTSLEDKDFIVHLSHTNKRFKQLFSRIVKEGFVPIVYNIEYDKLLGKNVELYWNVSLCRLKPSKITCFWKSAHLDVFGEIHEPLWKKYVKAERKKGDIRSELKLIREGFDKYKNGYVEVATKFNRLNHCYNELLKEREGVPQ